MFYVTGDAHGELKDLTERDFGKIKKSDYCIVCGDFGFIWDDSKEERKALKYLGERKHSVLFIDGAHENYDMLAKYPVTQWNGGNVQVINGGLIHLMRGQVYTIDGKKIFTFGGGESADREMRATHLSWWEQEMPTMEEMREGVNNLVKNNWEVDYILTHDAPSDFKKFLGGNDSLNGLNVYLDEINKRCQYKKWIFAMYHRNKHISNTHEAVFDSVIKLD